MGNVRTEQIKRVAKELMKRFPDKFSDNFDDNKRTVGTLVQGATIKVRNQIAGYITHALTGAEMETPPDEEPEEEGE